jgi:hypothetical protein
MNAHQLFEQFKADWKRDLSTLTFSGTILTGSRGLVSIDLAQAKMFVRRRPGLKPFLYINLPKQTGPSANSEKLQEVLMHPRLKGCGLDILDDLTNTLWAYISICLFKEPVDMDRIRLSPEAAEFFERYSKGGPV